MYNHRVCEALTGSVRASPGEHSAKGVIAEDVDGTGFVCFEYYEIHVDGEGVPLNAGSSLMLEGTLRVGYVRVLELRKLNGKRRVLRLSVPASSASVCSAVVAPLVCDAQGRWRRASDACPLLVPLTSLGRRVVASASADGLSDSYTIAAAPAAAGGPQLRTASLPPELFQAGGDGELEQDLMTMKVVELRAALEARGEAVSGNKAWLRRRLHTAVVRAYLAAAEADHGGYV